MAVEITEQPERGATRHTVTRTSRGAVTEVDFITAGEVTQNRVGDTTDLNLATALVEIGGSARGGTTQISMLEGDRELHIAFQGESVVVRGEGGFH